MKIVICGSIDFTPKIKEIADALLRQGHLVDIPLTSQRILNGEITLEKFLDEKKNDGADRKVRDDVIRTYYAKIKQADAILVLNLDKKGIKNYIGGNTFLEMGFAHVLNKTIYLYNDIPNLPYSDELRAMQPVILNGILSEIIHA